MPVTKDAADRYADDALNPFWSGIYNNAVEAFTKMGTLASETVTSEVVNPSLEDHQAMGIDINFDEYILFRFTAYVVPHEEN